MWVSRSLEAAIMWVSRSLEAAIRWVSRSLKAAILWVSRSLETAIMWVSRSLEVAIIWISRSLEAAIMWGSRSLEATIMWVRIVCCSPDLSTHHTPDGQHQVQHLHKLSTGQNYICNVEAIKHSRSVYSSEGCFNYMYMTFL